PVHKRSRSNQGIHFGHWIWHVQAGRHCCNFLGNRMNFARERRSNTVFKPFSKQATLNVVSAFEPLNSFFKFENSDNANRQLGYPLLGKPVVQCRRTTPPCVAQNVRVEKIVHSSTGGRDTERSEISSSISVF